VTASVKDALRLGCSAIGFTIYFGADAQYEQIEEVREAAREAKACGLAVVVWAYPRGGALSKWPTSRRCPDRRNDGARAGLKR
jgi:class I fructose-bisphosphate aldolase